MGQQAGHVQGRGEGAHQRRMNLMTPRELAKKYPAIGERRIKEWMDRERDNLPYVQLGRGRYIDEADFIKFVDTHMKVRR